VERNVLSVNTFDAVDTEKKIDHGVISILKCVVPNASAIHNSVGKSARCS